MSKTDHEYTDNLVCPYCGYEDEDSWEVSPNDEDLGLIHCGRCEKQFYGIRRVTVNYTTLKARYGNCKACGKYGVIENHNSTLGEYKDLCLECGHKEKEKMCIEYCEKMQRKRNK